MSYQILCSFGRKRRYNLGGIKHRKFTSIPIILLVAHFGERWTKNPTGSETPVRVVYALSICSRLIAYMIACGRWQRLSGGARALRQVRHWSSDSNIDYRLPPDTHYEKAKRRTKCNHLSLGFDFHIVGQYPVGGSALNYFRLLIYEIFTVEDPSSQHHVNQTYEISAWLASIGNVKWPNSSLWAVRQSLTAQLKSGLF